MSQLSTFIFDDQVLDYTTPLSEFLTYNTPSKWLEFFSSIQEILEAISAELLDLAQRQIIFPSIDNIFRAFYLVDPPKIKVVILGQDPYHDGSATGLAFSVPKGRNINPSLCNIAQEVEACGFKVDWNIKVPASGDLTPWAKQGVLLLNTALTVRKGEAESHIKMWAKFTKELIPWLCSNTDAVFLLWGNKAQLFIKYFNKSTKYVKTSHPSPLGAHSGFLGSKCFNAVNAMVKESVDWSMLKE
jgi:uracil-DNA glycosylase